MADYEPSLPADTQGLDTEISRLQNDPVLARTLSSSGLRTTYKLWQLAEPVFDSSNHSHSDNAVPPSRPINTQLQSPFFALPSEIRSLIYEQFLSSNLIKFCPIKDHLKGARGAAADPVLPLLLSCRRIHVEAIPLLYSSNTWWLLNQTVSHLPSYISPSNLQSIRHVTMHYHTEMQHINSSVPPAPLVRLNWLLTCRALAQMSGLQTLDLTLYRTETLHGGIYPYCESQFLRPLALLTTPRKFVLRLRWPEVTLTTEQSPQPSDTPTSTPSTPLEPQTPDELTAASGNAALKAILPPNCEVVRTFESSGIAESFRTRMDRTVTEFPQRYCLVGWEEDCRREPESINECFPIPSQEGQRKGYLRTYRSMSKGK